MWVKTENSDTNMPAALSISGNHVIVRRRFVQIPADEERAAHYEYEEWQMTKEQYDVYQAFEQRMNEQDDALVELAELYAEQDDALVELAGMMAE